MTLVLGKGERSAFDPKRTLVRDLGGGELVQVHDL